jgi:hypothetical protein
MLLSDRKRDSPMRRPTFPFIGQGKDAGYMRERRKEEREKTKKETAPGLCRPSPPPVGPADDNEGVRMLRLCPSPVLQVSIAVLIMIPLSVTGAIGRRRSSATTPRPTLACGWLIDPLVWSHMRIEQHSVGLPVTVGDMSA